MIFSTLDVQNHSQNETHLLSTAEFLIFTKQSGQESIEVRCENETIWLTQNLMGRLFDVETHTINYHLKEVFKTGEIEENRTIRKFRITADE